MTRTSNSIRNIKFSLIGQFLILLSNFVTRTVFVRTLGSEYLGLNGLFTNILSILSLAELGVGSAIVYSMYKPLAEKDEYKLKGLMNLYKSAYTSIGIFVLLVGSLLTPFLDLFINEIPKIQHIYLIYLMYVFNSGISYFYSYKRSLLIADQKKYIESLYHNSFYLLRNFLQIIILFILKSFILYLSVQLILTLIENIIISKRVDYLYPIFKEKDNTQLEKKEKSTIFNNVKAMIYHKLGSVVVMGTDNLLIAMFVGLIEVGLYSNYLLIIEALNQIFVVIFQSMMASVGNLGATATDEKKKFIFNCIDLYGFWLYSFATISLFTLFNPFINIWLGEEYVFPLEVVLLIVTSFYLTGRRKSVLTFRDALGLFWHDRYKSIFESAINLIVSISLAKLFGIQGIILGTIVSTLSTSFWIEPFILYKHGFNSSVKSYFCRYAKYTTFMIIVGGLTFYISSIFSDNTIPGFIGKIVVCIVIPNIALLIYLWKSEEVQYLFQMFKNIIDKKIKR